MVNIILFLILAPLAAAFLLLVLPVRLIRRFIIIITGTAVSVVSVRLLLTTIGSGPMFYTLNSHHIDRTMLVLEMAMGLLIIILGVWKRRYFTSLLAAVQSGLILYFDLHIAKFAVIEYSLFTDQLSVVMALIIAIIGSLICLYSDGYMDEYHEHHGEIRRRKGYFLFLMFVFLSAMFGIVFSNHLLWLLFFWEVTTLCSFLLIGYNSDSESWNSAFMALVMNLAGGISFTCGVIWFFLSSGQLELNSMIYSPKFVALLPAVLLVIAGLVKSAQMPFSSWLTAAMVAPTPVSALLHSSTMVKAGVYLILKVAPVLQGTYAGLILSFVGGTTFVTASFIAVSQRNAKLVLAYSTIANLGLVVACGGIDSYTAIWSAIMLIIFHAVSKSLLFLSVGAVQNRLGTKDIEHMDYLISRMPVLAAVMVIGIAGMFLAPFGMLISKWVTLKAFIDFNPILAVMLAYGSAATLFFWSKWLGKILTIRDGLADMESGISYTMWTALVTLALSTIVVCVLFPIISSFVIEPYILHIYEETFSMAYRDMLIIMILMISLLVILPAGILYLAYFNKKFKPAGTYLGGRNIIGTTYMDAMGNERSPELKNYYLENIFGERKISIAGIIASVILISIMFGVVLI